VGAVLALFFTGSSFAQDTVTDPGSGFRISPVRQDVDLDKGDTETFFIELENVTDVVQRATAVVNDFAAHENESGTPQLLIGELAKEDWPYSIKPFILPIDQRDIDPGATETIPVTVSIPQDAAPGAYFGVVRFISGTGLDEDAGNVSLNASVGTIYLIRIPGDTIELLTLEQISASKETKLGSLFSSAPDSIAIRLRNDGNTYIAPFGSVRITDWTGKEVFDYELNDTFPAGNVLPESVRRFENAIEGIGSFGRYTVEANIAYGDGGNIISAKTAFWVVPWLTLALIALLISAIMYLSTRGVRRYNEMILRRAKGTRRHSK